MSNPSRSIFRVAILCVGALLTACRGSPFEGPSQVPYDSEQAVIDGRGGGGGQSAAAIEPMETDLEEMNSRDTDQDPVLNNDG
ncbi:MAG: hypothetical protein RLY21_2178 [Planctomycetota bacterium]|jgi:hypothetical protein